MKIIYYYHIPKCGGTTICRSLKEISKALGAEYHNFNFPMERFDSLEQASNNDDLLTFLNSINSKTSDFKFIHHHHGFYGMSEIFNVLLQEKRKALLAGNKFYLFTCVRDPLSFQLSRINYLRNSCGMTKLSFDDACVNTLHQNIMFKYFLYNHPKRWNKPNLDKQHFMKIIDITDKVFVLEELNHLYHWLERAVGIPVQFPARKENAGTYSLTPTEGQLEVLKRVNTLDQFFYDLASNTAEEI